MKRRFILTIDQSTSGTKVLLVDHDGKIKAKRAKEHKQYYPAAGWVEHDPIEIYENVKTLIEEIIEESWISPSEIVSISITNQRETALVWDAVTGKPAHRAIVWQDRRTASFCEDLKKNGQAPLVTRKTGLLLDPYFSATKWNWLLEQIRTTKLEGQWLAGTIDSWLIWKLTGGTVHATDYTNASRTLVFNIHSLAWDAELIELFGLGALKLPEVKASDEIFGYLAEGVFFPGGGKIPICGVMGDSQAALFAQRCTEAGMAKATYGTGSSVLLNVGEEPVESGNGLVTALAWKLTASTRYALEGIIHTSGDCLKWARDNMNLFETYDELERLTGDVEDTQGVYVIPAFVGLGAPYWDPNARAAFIGMNRGTTRAHVLRACLNSIAYQIRDVVDLMTASGSGVPLSELRTDGGASKNRTLMQFQAEMLGKSVLVSAAAELSALGAAYAGGLGTGFWNDEDLDAMYEVEGKFVPEWPKERSAALYHGWQQAVATILTK